MKGLALGSLDAAELTRAGIPGDRAFHVVGPGGERLNGKRVPRLTSVRPHYDRARGTLTLTFPDGAEVSGPIELGETIRTEFHAVTLEGHVVEGPWSAALSEHAGRPLTLIRSSEGAYDRGRDACVSVVSVAALDRLAEAAGVDGRVDGRRFRMTLGVDGVAPHAEDGWIGRRVRVGEAVIVPHGNVGRCAVTTQDPDTGERTLDTLEALARYRAGVSTTEPLPFGVWGEVVEPGRIAVGDAVEPLDG